MKVNCRVWRYPLRTAAVVGAALVAAALTVGGARGAPLAPATMVVALTQEPDSLNPFLGGFSASTEMYELIYDELTNYSPEDNSPIPGLAESWSTSPDGLTWAFTIRTGVRWWDGHPLTAKDIAYTYNRILTGTTEQQTYWGYVANFAAVTAPDDATLIITTKVPTATMLAIDVPIVPEHVWRHITDTASFANTHNVVGSGPFQLVEYRPGELIRFEANQHYWRGAPRIKGLVFKFFKSADTAVQALRKGEIDLVGNLTPAHYRALRSEQHIALVRGQSGSLRELGVNVGAAATDGTPLGDGHPALRDRRVRLAIHHAVDKKTLVEKVLGGYAAPGTSLIPPMYHQWHYEPDEATRVEFDLGKANRILDEAGYRRGPDGIRRMPDGTRKLAFRLYGRATEDASVRSTEYIAGWLRQIGVEIDRRIMEDGQLGELNIQGQFDLYHWSWRADPDPDFLLSVMTCAQRPKPDGKGGHIAQRSDAMYCNPTYDRLYQEQAQTVDQAKRTDIVKRMQKILYQDGPYIVLYYENALEAYRSDRFTGFQLQPKKYGMTLRQAGSWSYLSVQPVSHEQRPGGVNGALLGGAAIAVAMIAAGAFAAKRRRATADERE